MTQRQKNKPQQKRDSNAPRGAQGVSKTGSASRQKPDVKTAMREVETGVTHLAQAVKSEVQNRTGEAIEQIKENLSGKTEQAEKLIEKIPGVGPDAAQKLHDAVHDEPHRPQR